MEIGFRLGVVLHFLLAFNFENLMEKALPADQSRNDHREVGGKVLDSWPSLRARCFP